MEKILLISSSSTLEDRLGNLMDSPRHIARISSWSEARRLLTKTVPATVVIGQKMAADPSTGTELVHLNNVLKKDGKPAYLIADPSRQPFNQWLEMFEVVDDVVAPPSSAREWMELRDLLQRHIEDDGDDPSTSPSDATSSSAAEQAPEVVIRLPKITSGSLTSLPLGRIIYCLGHRQSTGVLALESGHVERSFAFRDGQFVEHPDHDAAHTLTGAFAWAEGEYEFVSRDYVSGQPSPVAPLIERGLVTHRSQRQLMDRLMPRMSTYPTPTNLWTRRRDELDWNALGDFIAHCDGRQTLEAVFSKMGNQVTDAFRAAAFSRDTDLVVFRSSEADDSIQIHYEGVESTAEPTESNPSTPTLDESTSSPADTSVDELRSRFQTIKNQTAHQIFDVWKGCGREVVKETFYSMVKDHHPDAYGGNVSPEVRELTQKIFVEIRNAYTELLETEDEQTVPPPDQRPRSSSQPGNRRRRKQVSTLRPDQSADDSTQTPNRKRSSTPIAMGRSPTSPHPDSQPQSKTQSSKPGSSSNSSPPSKPESTESSPGKKRRPTPPPSMSSRDASSTSEGLDDVNSDPEWRREQLERLQKKSKTPKRRPSPVPSSNNKNTSSDNPARQAFNVGYKRFKNHRYQEALTYFEKAHQAQPEHSLYMTFYAYCLFQTDADRVRDSVQLLKQAIRQEDRQSLPDAHLFMGHILKAQEREHRAYKHFKKALKLNPASRAAEREIRLYERRHGDDSDSKKSSEGGFFKKLFKD